MKELLLQISIILVCLIVLVFSDSPTNAQMFCNNEPPIKPNRPTQAWPQGRQISVVIFDTSLQNEIQAIDEGLRDWNSHNLANCAGVVFLPATVAEFPYMDGMPIPDDTVHVTRPANSQWDPEFRNFGTPFQNVRAGRVRIDNHGGQVRQEG